MTIQQTLQERVYLTTVDPTGDDVYLSVPTVSQTITPNALKIQPLEEVFIICNTTNGPLNIYFPSISDFGNFWNVKIYLVLSQIGVPAGPAPFGPAAQVNLFPFPGSIEPFIPANTFNGNESLSLTYAKDSYFFHIVEDVTWISLYCPGPNIFAKS